MVGMRGPEQPLEETIASLRAAGAYRRARDVALRAVRDVERSGGSGTEAQALAMLELGRRHDDLGDYDEAGRAFNDAVEVAQALPDGQGVAALGLALRAGIDRTLARLGEAERAMARAISLAEEKLDADHPWRLEILAEAAMLRIARGDLDVAAALGSEALEAAERLQDGVERDRVLAHAPRPRGLAWWSADAASSAPRSTATGVLRLGGRIPFAHGPNRPG